MGQMKVEGLFLDYDGTISPLNIPRQESRVPDKIGRTLHQIKQLIPVGVITTKDLSFIVPRTPFASAWRAIAGLEMKIGDRMVRTSRVPAAMSHMSLALEYARRLSGNYMFIEEKRDLTGQTIAFCVDWRCTRGLKEAKSRAIKVMDYCKTLPLTVIKYEGQPFFDVYPCYIDKGEALTQLKQEFGLQGGVMYMGDSKVDNPAFKAADISIGVMHEESVVDLDCNYYVRFEGVASFLQHLLENNLVFDNEFPMITARGKMGWRK